MYDHVYMTVTVRKGKRLAHGEDQVRKLGRRSATRSPVCRVNTAQNTEQVAT
jgi:hypothetical protein